MKTIHTKSCFALGVLALAAAQAHAQWMGGPMRHDAMFLAAGELERERVVQNAPYCADAVHETVQALADGNRIVQRQQTRQCRDGQGRTRQELGGGNRRKVFLRDPVANESWMLDPDAKTAMRLDGPRGMEGEAARWDWLRDFGRDMREWSRDMQQKLRAQLSRGERPALPEPPQPPQVPQSAIAAEKAAAAAEKAAAAAERGAEAATRAVRIVIDGPDIELPPPPPMGALPPPMVAFQARLHAPRGAGTVTPLASETIDGVRADGKRTTWTIEAGRIGNEKPIVMTREVWSSPELMITLRSRDVDPLAGEDSYRVQNLTRSEPDAALFRVPADYTKVTPPAMPSLRKRG